MHPKLLLSKELYKRLISVLANLQHSWDLGYSRSLEELGALRQLQRTYSTINRHKREQEIMST